MLHRKKKNLIFHPPTYSSSINYNYVNVSPKRWYHGAAPPFSLASPPFNFKVYAGKQWLNIVGLTSCNTDALLHLQYLCWGKLHLFILHSSILSSVLHPLSLSLSVSLSLSLSLYLLMVGDIHTWEGVVNSVRRLVQSRDSKFIISLHQLFPHLSGNEWVMYCNHNGYNYFNSFSELFNSYHTIIASFLHFTLLSQNYKTY